MVYSIWYIIYKDSRNHGFWKPLELGCRAPWILEYRHRRYRTVGNQKEHEQKTKAG